VIRRSPDLQGPTGEAAGLKVRGAALRHAASVPGADPRPLLDAALAELDAAVDALALAGSPAAVRPDGDPADEVHAERRLLHAVFQQAPVPLFLLGRDGAVRRVNAAAGELLGLEPGYSTGKLFTAFIDLPSRAAAASQIAAAVRSGEPRQLRCTLLSADGAVKRAVTVRPVSVRGDTGQLIVVVAPPPAAAADGGRAGGKPRRPAEPAAGVVEAMTRRLDLVTSATRILLENVTYSEPVALQQYARLLARELNAWVIVDVERRQRLRRQLVAGPEAQGSDQQARAVSAIDPEPDSAPYQVHESGSSLLVSHTEDAGSLGRGPDGVPLLMLLGATSLLCVPLSDGERSYGVLTVAGQPDRGPFGLADVGLVEELGEQLALAIRVDRLFRRRTEVAEALQASLLPRELRQIPGAEIAATHVPATDELDVGGDFYDVYPTQGGWGVAVGDVCGKGEDAAAVTAAARHAIRVVSHANADPAVVLREANEIMLEEEFGGRFVTASVGHLRWQDGALRVALASAGHPAPVLIRPDGRTQVLAGGGLPLGIFPDAAPAAQEHELGPGDVLFFYTDGLTSACGPDMVYFEERLTDELAALAGKGPDAMVARVREAVLKFCRGQLRDDLTMLALRVGEPPAG
jgi:serine phosphatase RsbU (regulator of sigma subunit)/PAS domain-containing protein